jgi:hypothetical protein
MSAFSSSISVASHNALIAATATAELDFRPWRCGILDFTDQNNSPSGKSCPADFHDSITAFNSPSGSDNSFFGYLSRSLTFTGKSSASDAP